MCFGLIALLFLVEVFGIAPKAHAVSTRCPTGRIPNDRVQGENIARNGNPLYILTIEEKLTDLGKPDTYTLRLQGQRHKKFRDAVLLVESQDNGCGTGFFNKNSSYLYQPSGCPHVITTQRKQKMGRAAFDWTAPQCGCVLIRAVVHSGKGIYYAGNARAADDHLTVTKCFNVDVTTTPETTSTLQSTTAAMTTMTRTVQDNPKKIWTREDRLETLCKTMKQQAGASLADSKHFRHRHQLTVISDSRFEHIKLVLENRRTEIKSCCEKNGRHRHHCIADIRRRRIDRFCAKGQPDIPFTHASVSWLRDREEQCCWELGGARYRCFDETVEKMAPTKWHRSLNQQDEFDPVNDLDDYLAQNQKEDNRNYENGNGGKPDDKQVKQTPINSKSAAHLRDSKADQIKTGDLRLEVSDPDKVSDGNNDKDTSLSRKLRRLDHVQGTAFASSVTSTSNAPILSTTTEQPITESPTFRPPIARGISSQAPASKQSSEGDEESNINADSRRPPSPKKKSKKRRDKGGFSKDALSVLAEKAWKLNLKLDCCNKGTAVGSIASSAEVLLQCMHSAGKYSAKLSKGKRICRSYFMMCCANAVTSFSGSRETSEEDGVGNHTPLVSKRRKNLSRYKVKQISEKQKDRNNFKSKRRLVASNFQNDGTLRSRSTEINNKETDSSPSIFGKLLAPVLSLLRSNEATKKPRTTDGPDSSLSTDSNSNNRDDSSVSIKISVTPTMGVEGRTGAASTNGYKGSFVLTESSTFDDRRTTGDSSEFLKRRQRLNVEEDTNRRGENGNRDPETKSTKKVGTSDVQMSNNNQERRLTGSNLETKKGYLGDKLMPADSTPKTESSITMDSQIVVDTINKDSLGKGRKNQRIKRRLGTKL